MSATVRTLRGDSRNVSKLRVPSPSSCDRLGTAAGAPGAAAGAPPPPPGRLAVARVAVERARRRELAELVADHVLGDEHRDELAAVVHREGQPDASPG